MVWKNGFDPEPPASTASGETKPELIHNMQWCCTGMIWDRLGAGLQRPTVLQPLSLGPSGKGFLYAWPTGSLMVVRPCPSMFYLSSEHMPLWPVIVEATAIMRACIFSYTRGTPKKMVGRTNLSNAAE